VIIILLKICDDVGWRRASWNCKVLWCSSSVHPRGCTWYDARLFMGKGSRNGLVMA